MTSSSNVIKLHNLRLQKVIIGPGTPSGWGRAARRSDAGQTQDHQGIDREGVSGMLEGTLAFDWVSEVEDRLQGAHQEAQAIIDRANAEAAEIRQKAYEEGHSEGLALAQMEVAEAVGRIADLARNASIDSGKLRREAEEELVQLALAVAAKVVHRRLEEERSLIASMVDGAMECIDVVKVVRIRVNPEDLEILKGCWEQTQTGSSGRNIELAADPHVEVGGCIIDTDSSTVDAQIETKLAEIEQAFKAASVSRER